MLELRQVSKSFGDLTVLYPTDFAVPQGSTTVLIGPSGCGKSTLLRMIVGLIQPDGGKILFQETELTPKNAEQLCGCGWDTSFKTVACFRTFPPEITSGYSHGI